MARLIHEVLKDAREQRGWSTSVLSRQTVAPDDTGIGEKTIAAIEKNPGRVPEVRVLRALARALDMAPEEFYEWPIAEARATASATPEAARRREADALRKRAQRQREHLEDAPDATQAPRRRKGAGG